MLLQSTEVTYEDQQHINTFNKANQHMHELEAELKAQRVRLSACCPGQHVTEAKPCMHCRLWQRTWKTPPTSWS